MARAARGTAMIELAVFGGIALAALGFLIRVGMKMNYDQEIRMAVFRKALAAAAADNGTNQDATGVLYHYIVDRQMPNPTDGFMTMPRSRTEASAFVEWGDRLTAAYDKDPRVPDDRGRKTQPRVIVRVNGEERTYRMEEFPVDDSLPLGGGWSLTHNAFHGIVRESWTDNASTGAMTQTKTGSSLSSSTGTHSKTVVNTLSGDTIETNIGAPTTTVNW